MKIALVLLVVCMAIFLWRKDRPRPPEAQKRASRSGENRAFGQTFRRRPSEPIPMLACTMCGVHVPQDQAVRGAQGVYCCRGHKESCER